MGDEEWRDGDDPKLRKLLGYALRDHVAYQDGRDSEAPALLFADYDYEVGDGTCGVSEDGKRCNEPAIVYARADALMDAIDRAEKAEAERDTAWNGAIEAAAGAVREKWATQTNAELEAAILALRKGEPT